MSQKSPCVASEMVKQWLSVSGMDCPKCF